MISSRSSSMLSSLLPLLCLLVKLNKRCYQHFEEGFLLRASYQHPRVRYASRMCGHLAVLLTARESFARSVIGGGIWEWDLKRWIALAGRGAKTKRKTNHGLGDHGSPPGASAPKGPAHNS